MKNYYQFLLSMNERNAKWLGILLLLFFYLLFGWQNHLNDYSVLIHYINAAEHWICRQNLYSEDGIGFLYLPQSAIFFIPFYYLQNFLNLEWLWRGFWILLSGLTLWYFCKYYFNKKFPIFFIFQVFCLMAMGSDTFRSGQLTIALIIFGILALFNISKKNWNWAAFFLVLGLAVKTTFIVLYLLAFVLFPKVRWKLLLFTIVFAVLPFFTAPSTYVIHQYHDAFSNLIVSANYSAETPEHYIHFAQLFTFFYLLHIHIPFIWQTILRLIFAFITLLVAIYIIHYKKNLLAQDHVMALYSLFAVYLLLFNPRTENNDYILIAPAFAWLWQRFYLLASNAVQLFMFIMLIAFIFHHDLSQLLWPPYTTWLAPLTTSIWAIVFIWTFIRVSYAQRYESTH